MDRYLRVPLSEAVDAGFIVRAFGVFQGAQYWLCGLFGVFGPRDV
jgi:hypothetical protein